VFNCANILFVAPSPSGVTFAMGNLLNFLFLYDSSLDVFFSRQHNETIFRVADLNDIHAEVVECLFGGLTPDEPIQVGTCPEQGIFPFCGLGDPATPEIGPGLDPVYQSVFDGFGDYETFPFFESGNQRNSDLGWFTSGPFGKIGRKVEGL